MTSGYITELKGHRWTIEKYSSSCNEHRVFLRSPSFVTDGQFQWHIKLYPITRYSRFRNFVSVALFSDNHFDNPVNAKFEFAILDQNNKLNNLMVCHESKLFDSKKNHWGFDQFLETDNLLLRVVFENDSLTLYCRVIVDIQESTSYINKPFEKFHSFLQNKEFSDVTINVSGDIFKTHKIILASESPVFYAMFKHDMSEKQSNTVEIMDIDANLFNQVLNFIYKGEVENFNISKELLAVAERYQFDRLKDKCENYFCKNITIENAIEYLAFADLHNANKLKTCVNDFIIANAEKIVQTEEFKKMNKLQPYLLTELFHKLVNVRIVNADTISSSSSYENHKFHNLNI